MSNAILAATLAQSLRAMGRAYLEAASILSDAASATPEADTQAVKADTLPTSSTYDPADPAKATNPADLVNPGLPGIRIDNAIDWSTAKPEESAKQPTKDEVLAEMRRLCKAGHSAEAKAILSHYGAASLSEADPRYYRDIITEIESLVPTNNEDKEN